MDTEDRSQAPGPAPPADARLIEQLRLGDAEASHQFVREYYPGVYRYLLYLTGRREAAEDLAQETFLQAWRRLETFEGRAPLRLWLHRIAHREFLQAVRSQRSEPSLDEVAEPLAPRGPDWTEAVDLRDAIRKLPREEREIVLLHYLQGYNCQEIAQIVHVHVSTVKYRLTTARAQLQRELGEGDLTYLNPAPEAVLRRWTWLPLEALAALEGRLSMKGERKMSDEMKAGMSRRKLLEAAGTAAAAAAAAGMNGAAAAATPRNEAEIIDDRLTRKVTLAVKATALADLCAQLRADTGIEISAGPSVADEKVTLFCEKLPLREVMRQLSRPFGYTWLRSRDGRRQTIDGSPALGRSASGLPSTVSRLPSPAYRYELLQDLRSQLLEEELRNRDRNTALLVLEHEIQRYRPYLDLSPDEALTRAQTAPPEEKKLLEKLAGAGWGPIQMYFRLSSSDLATLRAGRGLCFEELKPGEPSEWVGWSDAVPQPLPPDIARGVLQSWREYRLHRREDGFDFGVSAESGEGLPPSALPEARAVVFLSLNHSELGQFAIEGASGFGTRGSQGKRSHDGSQLRADNPYAVGQSLAVLQPDNATVNARLARDPALQGRVTVEPELTPQPPSLQGKGESPWLASNPGGEDHRPPSPSRGGAGEEPPVAASDHGSAGLSPPSPSRGGAGGGVGSGPKLTSADVLEALHQATGLPIIADFYTRLYPVERVSVHDRPLFEALNALGDAMRMRWHKEADTREASEWLEFRSTSFYDDRLKEVPNRLLSRWAAARRQHTGGLALDELIEIAQLPDAQLDGAEMAEGARECWGLAEWDLARHGGVRAHLRYLAGFTSAQRQQAMSPAGLPLTAMSLTQQQGFFAHGIRPQMQPLQTMEDLAGAVLRIDYRQPGGFEWRPPGPFWLQWIAPLDAGENGRRVPYPVVRGRTRQETLQALRALDPQLRQALAQAALRFDPHAEAGPILPPEAQIVPTELDLTIIYIPGTSNKIAPILISPHMNSNPVTW